MDRLIEAIEMMIIITISVAVGGFIAIFASVAMLFTLMV